jgi:ubiquinone/menaquinone biosynthesis C-methylase UbiE
MSQLTYNPAIFNVNDLRSAMRIILTPETWTTERRWEIETPYFVDLIHQSVEITPQTVLLDYGSGIGRIAKELIARYQCRVVGVDISASMRTLAAPYVQSDRFLPCSPAMLETLSERDFRFDAAIAVWVLQHCLRPAEDIKMIQRVLKPDARLFVVNATYRAVPALERPWVNDGIDVKRMLSAA